MATNYTSLLGFALPTTGELDGTWGATVNNSITELVEDAIAATASADVTSANWTLTTTGSGGVNQARCAILIPTGTPGVSRNIIAPSQSKAYIVINQSNAAVVLKGAATTGVTIPSNIKMLVAWNGSDFVQVGESVVVTTFSGGTTGLTPSTGTSGAVTLAGTLNAANGGTGRSTLTSGAILLGNGTGQVGQLSGSSVGQVPQWNGTTWSVGSLPSGGVTNVTASAPIASSGGSAPNISLTGTVAIANGGTGQTGTPTNGQLLIGNGSGFTRATLTAGSNVSITNGAGTISIAATGSATNLGVTGGTTAGPIITSSTGTSATIPTASATASGAVTTGAQTWAGVKTFNSAPVFSAGWKIDNTYSAFVSSGSPNLVFDTGDGIVYNRTTNTTGFVVGNITRATINATDLTVYRANTTSEGAQINLTRAVDDAVQFELDVNAASGQETSTSYTAGNQAFRILSRVGPGTVGSQVMFQISNNGAHFASWANTTPTVSGPVGPAFYCRAFVNFNGTTSPGTLRSAANVSSVTKNNTGLFTVNFANAFIDANYVFAGAASRNVLNNFGAILQYAAAPTTTSQQIYIVSGGDSPQDPLYCSVAFFR